MRGRVLLYSVDLSYVNVVAFQRAVVCMLVLTLVAEWSFIVAKVLKVEVCFSKARSMLCERKGAELAG